MRDPGKDRSRAYPRRQAISIGRHVWLPLFTNWKVPLTPPGLVLSRPLRSYEHVHGRHHKQRQQRADAKTREDHQPMSWRPAAPAPDAHTNGATPKTMAAVVMRMGRRRTAAAS